MKNRLVSLLAGLVLVILPNLLAAKKSPRRVCPNRGRECVANRQYQFDETEAERRGIELKFSDGQGKQENQIRAVRSFIAQRVDAIVIAPIVEAGWGPRPARGQTREYSCDPDRPHDPNR